MKMVLKERQFAPTGRDLGIFSAIDLEPFDLQWTETDEPKQGQSGNGPKSKVPPPLDNKEEQVNKDLNDLPDKFDMKGQDLDDKDDEYTPPPSDNGPGGGSSDGGLDDGSSNGNGQHGDPEGGQQGGQQGGQPEGGQQGGQQGGQPEGGQSGGNHGSSGRPEDAADGTNGSKPGRLDNSGSKGQGQDIRNTGNSEQQYDDYDDEEESDYKSEMEKALEELERRSSETTKRQREADRKKGDIERNNQQNPRSQRNTEAEERALRDMVGKALKEAKADKLNSGDEVESQEDILRDMGLGSITSLFNPGNLHDWRSRLAKILDRALGFDIVTNPNLINKKIEDAPPGREDEVPQIEHIVILIDMSGSMGSTKFKEVISHIDTMIKARNLRNVWFHIVPFGPYNSADEVARKYEKVKGRMLKTTMMTKFKNATGITDFLPGVQFCAIKIKRPDAIIVMTDARFNGSTPQQFAQDKAGKYFRKHKKKIIWALTMDAKLSGMTDYDPTAKTQKRYIKFKKGGSSI